MKRIIARLSPRDSQVLMFLWLWKVAPLSIIQHRYYPGTNLRRAYHRLNQLNRAGLVKQIILSEIDILPGESMLRLWALSNRGYQHVKGKLPPLKEDGYRSENPLHDWLVSSFHLGNYLGAVPETIKLCTEQQLRRFEPRELPEWIPPADHHRPDGYWGVMKESAQVAYAIEVELHAKRDSDYQVLGEFYAIYPQVDRVFWLVPTKRFAERIQKAIQQCHQERTQIHSYLLLSQFQDMGWKAPIVYGQDCSKTLDQILPKPARPNGVQGPSSWTEKLWMSSSISTAIPRISSNPENSPHFN